MKVIRTILFAVVLVIANHGAAGADENSIVPGASLGGISLGPNGVQELKKLGKPYRLDRGMSQTFQVWKWAKPDGRFDTFFVHTVNNGVIDAQPVDGVTIDLVRTTADRFHTASGIAVGSTLDQIRKSFPEVAPVQGTPTVFDDLKRGIAFEFSASPIGHSVCIAIMVHLPGQSKTAAQAQVAQVLESGSEP